MKLFVAFLLVVAYAVAIPPIFRFRSIFADRRGRWFAVLMGATVAVAIGHFLAGRPIAAGVNVAAVVILAGAWWETGRRRRRPA